MENPIAILPIGDVPLDDLNELTSGLERILEKKVTVLPQQPLPVNITSGIKNKSRKGQGLKSEKQSSAEEQYDVAPFMAEAQRYVQKKGDKYLRILAVTEEDLYTPGLNFIFGQAEVNGRCCVISTARLKYYSFWLMGRHKLEQRDKFVLRMIKEAVHELGHTFGLTHCSKKTCVMHFSNRLEDTDIKSEKYCRKCQRDLQSFSQNK